MPPLLALDLAATDAPPAAGTPDRTGLIVLGVLVGAVLIAMWRPLLRLLLVALVALIVIGLGVVMTPVPDQVGTPPTGNTQAPAPTTTAPAVPNTQRAQTG